MAVENVDVRLAGSVAVLDPAEDVLGLAGGACGGVEKVGAVLVGSTLPRERTLLLVRVDRGLTTQLQGLAR